MPVFERKKEPRKPDTRTKFDGATSYWSVPGTDQFPAHKIKLADGSDMCGEWAGEQNNPHCSVFLQVCPEVDICETDYIFCPPCEGCDACEMCGADQCFVPRPDSDARLNAVHKHPSWLESHNCPKTRTRASLELLQPLVVRSPFGAKHHVVVQCMAR